MVRVGMEWTSEALVGVTYDALNQTRWTGGVKYIHQPLAQFALLYVQWINGSRDRQNKRRDDMTLIKMTTGLECFIPTGNGERLALVKVECEQLPSEEVRLTAISGRTLADIRSVKRVVVSAEEWEGRPTDPYDSTVEATWALGKLGLSPAGDDE